MLLESFEAGPYGRIVLEPQPEGVYVLVYDSGEPGTTKFDYLQDDLAMAKDLCREEYGTPEHSWHAYYGPEVMA